jgi:hypothetical protein
LTDLIHHLHSLHDVAKHCVLSVQKWGRIEHDIKLRVSGVAIFR